MSDKAIGLNACVTKSFVLKTLELMTFCNTQQIDIRKIMKVSMKLFVLNCILYYRKVVQRVLVLMALVLSAFVKTGILNK